MSRRACLDGLVLTLLVGLAGACRSSREWTVVSRSAARDMTRPCSRRFPEELTGYWRPGHDDIARAERALPRAIDIAYAELRASGENARRPEPYWRQYAGFFRGGKRVVYVHAIGDPFPEEGWPSDYIRVCDGWISSFGAVYDPAADAFDSLEFNGSLPIPPPPPPR